MGKDEPGKQVTQIEVEMMADNTRNMIPGLMQLQGPYATLLFKKYVELQNAGFKPAEALQIVIGRPIIE